MGARYDEHQSNDYDQNPRPPPQRSPNRSSNQRGFGQEIFESAELDNQIKQIEDELTIKFLRWAEPKQRSHRTRTDQPLEQVVQQLKPLLGEAKGKPAVLGSPSSAGRLSHRLPSRAS